MTGWSLRHSIGSHSVESAPPFPRTVVEFAPPFFDRKSPRNRIPERHRRTFVATPKYLRSIFNWNKGRGLAPAVDKNIGKYRKVGRAYAACQQLIREQQPALDNLGVAWGGSIPAKSPNDRRMVADTGDIPAIPRAAEPNRPLGFGEPKRGHMMRGQNVAGCAATAGPATRWCSYLTTDAASARQSRPPSSASDVGPHDSGPSA